MGGRRGAGRAPLAALPLAFGARLESARVAILALCLVSVGFAAATLRSRMVEAPTLAEAMDVTVEGRIVEITRSRTDRRRVLLEDVVIYGLSRDVTPERVRVTMLGGAFARDVRVGDRIAVFAHVGPPGAPVEPGGFDFRRWAWFEAIGAVGFARGPTMEAPPAAVEGPLDRIADWVARARGALSRGIQAGIPGENGAFASAILTGSRDGVAQPALDALRDSNLAHLLAISGLHMGLLTALIYGAVRLALALIPRASLYWNVRKIAAGAALAAALAYLVLSGASVATQRAFVMAAAALVALMLDRAPISLRALAAAAMVILLLRPESLLNVGFQMSFAATAALIAFYEEARDRRWFARGDEDGALRAVVRYAAALAVTSLIAGLATAPFAGLAFHRFASYGLLANLLAVPVMAFWVMPAGIASAALAPFGLEAPALWLMGEGIGVILAIARFAAGLPGAVRPVPAAHDAVLPLIALGGLWLCLWRTRLRLLGLAPLAAGLAMWISVDSRPPLLVAPGGSAMGLVGPQGRAVDRARGAGYAIESWLEADGDLASQAVAAARPGLDRDDRGATGELDGWTVTLIRGRVAKEALGARCEPRTLLIAPSARSEVEGGCVFLGRAALERMGAVSAEPAPGGGLYLRGALLDAAHRPWGAVARKPGGGLTRRPPGLSAAVFQ